MRIIIVEDEIRIRKGLVNLIQKISKNYSVVGEADNGKKGIELVLQLQPDLIITDIQMPIMNGLEMLNYFYEQQIMPKTIILSAYSEFSYAQRAIRFGVNEYLIKPIMVDELTNALKSVEQQLKAQRENKTVFQSQSELLDRTLRDQIILNDNLKKYALEKLSFDIDQKFAVLLAYSGEFFNERIDGQISYLLSLIRRELHKDVQMITYRPLKSHLFMIPLEKEESVIEKSIKKNILSRAFNDKDNHMRFYLSFFHGLAALKECIAEIKKSMDWSIVFEKEALLVIPRLQAIQTVPLTYPVTIEDQAKTAICMTNRKKLGNSLNEFNFYFRRGQFYAPREIKECYIRFIWSVISVAKGLDMITDQALDQQKILEKIMSAVTSKELENTLNNVYLLLPNEELEEQKMRLVTRRTKSLIHEFYSKGITLEEIAEKLNITPEYLGTQFHKEVGVSFSSYMKEYRIQKAKKLLLGTNLKLYEIADQVGYSDPKHFSKVFREITGQLPAEYRKLNK